jgi:hypothetical protein
MKMSEETKLKIGNANRGKVRSIELKEQWSNSHKGCIPWNKGKIGIYSEETLNKMTGNKYRRKITDEIHQFIVENIESLTQKQIATQFNLHQSTISKHLR